MRTQPIQWFFNRLGLGIALTQSRAAFSRRDPASLPLEEELLCRYLDEKHSHRF